MSETSQSTDQVLAPDECASNQLDAFAELVRQGSEVSAAGLLDRVRRAHWLGLHYEDNRLVAVAALKRPGPRYRDKVFRKAGMIAAAGVFTVELGWVFTCAKFRGRGLSRRLLEQLLEKVASKSLFATTRLDNDPMQRLLQSCGFQPVGQPYPGSGGERLLRLWVRGPLGPSSVTGILSDQKLPQ